LEPVTLYSFQALAPLNHIEGINLYILQANAEATGWLEGFGIHPGEFSLHDYARVIRGLDLLISADSMPAHLAGAMNVPVWTLLHSAADWRWMDERTDSPWYPSMQLFRQKDPSDWVAVIQRVAEELQKLAVVKRHSL
jgi:ADP-heptose:LPS heptosyltransferase